MELEKKKPYRSLGSNMWWSIKKQIQYAPLLLWALVLETPVNVALAYADLYLPSLVVAEVIAGGTLARAALRVGILLCFMLLGRLAQNALALVKQEKIALFRCACSYELERKCLIGFYQICESKKMRDLFARAKIATEMWNGVQPISDLPRQIGSLVESLLKYLLFGTVVSFVSPWLLLILTAAPLIQYVCDRAWRNWEYKTRDQRTDLGKKLDYITERPQHPGCGKDIRIYGLSTWLKETYQMLSVQRESWDRRLSGRLFLSRIAELWVILLRDGIAYGLLISMIRKGEITVDQFVLYFAAISSFATLIGGIVTTWSDLHKSSLALCDYREYLDTPDYAGTGKARVEDHLQSGVEIRFDHVCFRYEGAEADTLHDVNFTLHKGEKLALVGLNGAGKTTLVKLLCGLYLPTSGQILINGTPATDFYRKDYYRLFAPVFQTIKLPFFSLAEIVSGKDAEHTDLERAERCMIDAGLGEKLKTLPRGIHTPVDKQLHKDGIELSGGEAQKLMLARALYKNAPVLVLDEPTAALDPLAENHIYREYDRLAKGKTALFISHRLASTRFCDRVFYLEQGRIAEEGTHDQLIAAGGAYAGLYEIQSCWYREEGEQ